MYCRVVGFRLGRLSRHQDIDQRGIDKLGNHMLKGWSITQAVIALSSGEAEFYGIVKGASIGLGIRSILADLGTSAKIEVLTDSSAAKSIACREVFSCRCHERALSNEVWAQCQVF